MNPFNVIGEHSGGPVVDPSAMFRNAMQHGENTSDLASRADRSLHHGIVNATGNETLATVAGGALGGGMLPALAGNPLVASLFAGLF